MKTFRQHSHCRHSHPWPLKFGAFAGVTPCHITAQGGQRQACKIILWSMDGGVHHWRFPESLGLVCKTWSLAAQIHQSMSRSSCTSWNLVESDTKSVVLGKSKTFL